ncbi:hypothetical protein TWF481_011110 [Arthrobotrys musiformis]|uniref:Uncharacterized protein n=1 Tax=Arthrobotrys musiformis TaxID=47236 RepID=A0AAV9VYG5_9PEZI
MPMPLACSGLELSDREMHPRAGSSNEDALKRKRSNMNNPTKAGIALSEITGNPRKRMPPSPDSSTKNDGSRYKLPEKDFRHY